jgi:hypothetical protein
MDQALARKPWFRHDVGDLLACPTRTVTAQLWQETIREAIMTKRVLSVLCAAGLAAAAGSALAQAVDIQKAVNCQTLAQQFGDSIKAAKADDAVKKTATDQAKQGDQACNQHNYDAGMDQLRQALQQVGLKPAR